jgi:hypothetical protein
LQRRYDLIEAIEVYKKQSYRGSNDLGTVKARLLSLFLELQATLHRHSARGSEYEVIEKVCLDANSEEEVLGVLFKINKLLDKLKLIRIDNQESYDSSDIEAENKIKGF